MSKTKVGVLFGGRSGEHEVSLLSAASVLKAINKEKYEVVPIGISKEERWLTSAHAERLLQGNASGEDGSHSQLRAGDPAATSSAAVLAKGDSIIVPPVPQSHGMMPFESAAKAGEPSIQVDVIFPVLHGTFGEDGTIQGLFELAFTANVGPRVLYPPPGIPQPLPTTRLLGSGQLKRQQVRAL